MTTEYVRGKALIYSEYFQADKREAFLYMFEVLGLLFEGDKERYEIHCKAVPGRFRGEASGWSLELFDAGPKQKKKA